MPLSRPEDLTAGTPPWSGAVESHQLPWNRTVQCVTPPEGFQSVLGVVNRHSLRLRLCKELLDARSLIRAVLHQCVHDFQESPGTLAAGKMRKVRHEWSWVR